MRSGSTAISTTSNENPPGGHPRRTVRHARLLALGLWIGTSLSAAADPKSDFAQANVLYELGKFSEAAAAYEKILPAGQITPALYFNLGNAWFKSGQLGRAIAAYQQAEVLAPRDPDVVANLRFARESVAGSSMLPGSRWLRWLRKLALNEWALLTCVGVWLWFMLLILGQWRPAWKPLVRDYTRVAGVVACLLVVASSLTLFDRLRLIRAVVIVSEAVVRHGPLAESQSYYTLRDGAEVIVQDQQGDWIQVADAAQRRGWMRRENAQVLANLWTAQVMGGVR